MLKIAVLTRSYNKSGGGAERYCVELTERLAKIHDVHVFSQFDYEHSPNITFHKIPRWIKRPSFLDRLLFSYIAKTKTAGKFDIIHSHVLAQHADLYTFHVPCIKTKWSNAKGVKKFFLFLSTLFSPRKITYLLLENSQMKSELNRGFISVSEYLSRNLVQNYPQLANNLTIAYPGKNIIESNNADQIKASRANICSNFDIPDSAFVLLFAAHGFKRKGLPAIIKAMEALDNSEVHVIVAGSGDPSKITIAKNIRNNVHFLGSVKDMEEVYQAADALIHPTLADTYGMVVLEAMSHKLPVIVSSAKYCGFSEHLEKDCSILLNNPRDHIEISQAIKLLKTDAALRENIANEGYNKSIKLTWDQTLKQTLHAIDLIMQKK